VSGPSVTPWFPVDINPVRVGWYEYAGTSLRIGGRRYWNGKAWVYTPDAKYSFSPYPLDHWRGLTKPAEQEARKP
jgi:hypothetical protein